MEAQEVAGKVAEWAHRNPNGLQPFVAFADDYASPGRLHYNIPPLHVSAKKSVVPITAASHPMKWHGYNGSKPFFTQQPIPGGEALLLTGGYVSHRSSTNCVKTKQTDIPPAMVGSLPCKSVNVVVGPNQDSVRNVALPEAHPSQIEFPDSRVWKFDGRDHVFQQTSC
ncbi:expressed conserved protein [Echinococcus multilocularis]|uniref:Expressed conserved protein n=1 Tax=Echinococcus multilocularis TaxID=6211 RepID=A0A068XX43_ECHMU|nr:expressed conserved protein [Echinococcus multilocularis]